MAAPHQSSRDASIRLVHWVFLARMGNALLQQLNKLVGKAMKINEQVLFATKDVKLFFSEGGLPEE